MLSIVIPCQNEENSIDEVLNRILQAKNNMLEKGLIHELEVIVVNDASTDGTANKLNQHPWVQVIHHDCAKGYGGALKAGFQFSKGNWIAFFDMDTTYAPEDLPNLLSIVQSGKAQVVFGSRYEKNQGMPLIRQIGNFLFTFCVQVLYRQKISDVCTGFRILDRGVLNHAIQLSEQNLNYSMALTLMILNKKINFSEVSIQYAERVGESKLNELRDGFAFLGTVLQFYKQHLSSKLKMKKVVPQSKQHELPSSIRTDL